MKTWRDTKWEYDDGSRCVIAHIGGEDIIVCVVPWTTGADTIGRAIAFAWNMDLAQAQWARELFGVEDSVVNVRDSAP